jgi:hypothetical protein
MSNPTSNFNWQMPTNTDLVTDLPADFEVFGQAVDTSLADLKGGTTGQYLQKNTNADMDFVWAAVTGGGWTSIASGALPAGSALAITSIPTTYQQLVFIIRNAVTSGSANIGMRFNNNSTSGVYFYGISNGEAASATMTNAMTSSTSIAPVGFGTDNDPNDLMLMMTVNGYASSASNKLYNGQVIYSTNATDYRTANWWGGFKSNTAITELNVTNTNFTGGSYVLYGVK